MGIRYFIYKLNTSTKTWLGDWRNPIFIVGAVTLIIVVPLFRPGFIFLLDWTPLPHTPFPALTFRNDFPLQFIWWFLDLLLPGGFLQKMAWVITFFLSGFGMFRLIVKIYERPARLWAAYFGAIFYMCNPFVYSRMLVGQWILIAAYALMPWFFVSLLKLMERPNVLRATAVAGWWTAIIIFALHAGVFTLIPFLLISVGGWISAKGRRIALLKGYVVVCLMMVLFNIYWIIPVMTGTSHLATFAQHTITTTDILSFFTRPDPVHGVLWNTAAMYGFWGDEDMRYVSQKIFVSHWFYLFFFLFFLVIWGFLVSIPKVRTFLDRKKAHHVRPAAAEVTQRSIIHFALAGVGSIAFLLAVGVAYEPLKPATLWLYDHIPFFRGFREPHKFVALLVFVYAVFSSIGVGDLLERIERLREIPWRWVKLVAPGVLLIVPIIYSPGMLWGFHGQIKPSQYPDSWFAADRFLSQDQDEFRVLFLPWHKYISLSFAHNVIANPAEEFFHKPTIAGDNIEFGSIYTQSARPESRYVEQEILAHTSTLKNMGKKLLPLRIKYVLLPEESDFMNYSFVEQQKDLKLIFAQDRMRIFLNLAWDKALLPNSLYPQFKPSKP